MPECAPVSTHPGQEGLREAGSGAKTGLEEPHGQRSPVTCLALDAKRALCSPSLSLIVPLGQISQQLPVMTEPSGNQPEWWRGGVTGSPCLRAKSLRTKVWCELVWRQQGTR